MIRHANIEYISKIQELEKQYYGGHFISKNTLAKWIINKNFFVIEENTNIVGSIYFELLDKIKDLPWEHPPLKNKTGKYIYISEIAVDSKKRVAALFNEVLKVATKTECRAIIWLTGEKATHDKIEQGFLKQNNFKKLRHVKNWECAPNYFIHDHSLWLREVK